MSEPLLGKKSNAGSKIITLQAGLIRNLMSFKAVFLATVGEDAMDIFDGFKFEQEADMQDLGKIMNIFEDFCVGETPRTVRNSQSIHLLSVSTGKEL